MIYTFWGWFIDWLIGVFRTLGRGAIWLWCRIVRRIDRDPLGFSTLIFALASVGFLIGVIVGMPPYYVPFNPHTGTSGTPGPTAQPTPAPVDTPRVPRINAPALSRSPAPVRTRRSSPAVTREPRHSRTPVRPTRSPRPRPTITIPTNPATSPAPTGSETPNAAG